MSRMIKFVIAGIVIVALVGVILAVVMKARVESERTNCQNHLRELGLNGVRHATAPGVALPNAPQSELPPGTFLNPTLPADQRMSWYVYTLNVLEQGAPNLPEKAKQKHRSAYGLADAVKNFDPKEKWNEGKNADLARYRLSTAICPAQTPNFSELTWMPANYVACGGLGLDTPKLDLLEAGKKAGAYRYDGPTPDKALTDGLRQTANIIETNIDIGAWLQGGPTTLRGLDTTTETYIGAGRPFGGCHPGGVYVSMADGSVQFVRDSINPAIFRALLTIAGGTGEESFDSP
jgi:prepilin-type processing-associated H-X9-DG protein